MTKLNYETAVDRMGETRPAKTKHAMMAQNVFRTTVRRAQNMGMKVNTSKTNLLVIPDALTYDAEAFIEDADGEALWSGGGMKVLGFVFSGKPTAAAHVEALRKKFRKRYWILLLLKNFGFNQEELCKVYRTIVRPVADYCCVVYHSLLNDRQDELIEQCQSHALRCIFGKDMSYSKMREKAAVGTLRQRREELCDKFAKKCAGDPLFSRWFPLKNTRSGRGSEKYLESFARCDRLRNSPLFYMRRRLNGKAGKTYGARNAERRAGVPGRPERLYPPGKGNTKIGTI